jgi:FtsZ-binding cell division protein ZapB
MLLQVARMTDEVTVSSLPHPISMFFLGTFAITIIVVVVEMNSLKKERKFLIESMKEIQDSMEKLKVELESKLLDVSKKIDSRVDKAVSTLKLGK